MLVQMKIDKIPESKPVQRQPYPMSSKIVHRISGPVPIVKKKNGDSRMVVDYRRLNAQTLKDKFPMPRIDDIITQLSTFLLFIINNGAHGFLQIDLTNIRSTRQRL